MPANLVSWWTGNDTAADVMGVHAGTLVGGASYAPGKVGQGFSFDGINDTVTLAGTFGGGPEATLEAWVKTTGTNRDVQAIISATEDQFVHLQLSSWQVPVAFSDSGRARLTSIPQTPTDTWRHIAITIKSGDSRLYVDGGLVGTSTLTFTSLLTTSTFRIGSGRGGGRFFQGGIDEVSYYSRALNAGEIQGIYNAGSDGKVFSPIAIDAPSAIEGSTGVPTPVNFTLTRTDTSVPLTVDWKTEDNTATAGLDYVAASGSVTFAVGQATTTVQVTVNGDNSPEANETLKLILTPVGQSPVMGLATILEDDVGVSVSDATATEGDVRIGQSLGAFVSQSNNGGLDLATGMAWGPDGNLYVGSYISDRGPLSGISQVLRFDGTTGALMGTFISNVDSPAVQGLSFRPASPEAPDGTLYVLSRDTAQVQRYNAKTGAPLGVFITPGSGGLSTAKGMTFGPDGNWYISSGTNQVLRYRGTDGAFMGVFVSAGSGGLSGPRGLTFGPDGNLYVTSFSHAVLRYNGQSGAFINAFIPAGRGGLQSPGEILFRNGSLYVSSQWTQEVLRYDSQTGAFLDKAATGSGSVLGLLFDSHNNLLVGGLKEILLFGPQSQASFTVRLNIPSATPVTVNYTTASGSATAGSDFTPTSGTPTLTFAPGQTTKTIIVPTQDDAAAEPTETFTVILSNPVGAVFAGSALTINGVGTITDDDTTKFYVVDDGSTDQTYRYGVPGNTLVPSTMASGNTAPRGAASTDGTTVWVVDANKTVYVYNAAGVLQGSWTARGLPSNATVEGLATNGTDIWIVDKRSDKVYKYTGAAGWRSELQSQSATSNFGLNAADTTPKGIVTDGTSLWVVDDGTTDKVFKYTLTGGFLGSWTIDTTNSHPTGLTINPANVSDIWIVDNGTDKVYQYTAAASRISGSQIASATFALAIGNTNPQDIADPPPSGDSVRLPNAVMTPATASGLVAPLANSKASDRALSQLSDDSVRGCASSTFEMDRTSRQQSLVAPQSSNSRDQFESQQFMQPARSENRASSQAKRLVGTTDDIFSNWSLDELKDFEMVS